ncbi:MAG: ferritin family protein [Planctomycetes bacterium]|nr:ferritin family protein [Planctomycetota bacterium]
MSDDHLPSRGPDKLLAIGAYGETVAAYRYLILSEKAPTEDDRRAFAAMSDEEQDHKQRLQELIADLYPKTDFVLTPEDKDLVVTGPRLLDIRDAAAFADAMRIILETERKTAGFYAQNGRHFPESRIRDLFNELAEEGADHYQRLSALAKKSGVTAG